MPRIKKDQPVKPHLMEIFAAFNGIGHAAMSQKLDSPLGHLEKRSSDLRYRLRQVILDEKQAPDAVQYQDRAAQEALALLIDSLVILKKHKDITLISAKNTPGGTLADVVAHIEDMQEREEQGQQRPLVYAKGGGDLYPPFKPGYLPSKLSAEEDEKIYASDDQKIHQALSRKGGGKPKYKEQDDPSLPAQRIRPDDTQTRTLAL
jgi:hypothetical protein